MCVFSCTDDGISTGQNQKFDTTAESCDTRGMDRTSVSAIVGGELPPGFGRAGIVALRDDNKQIVGGTWSVDPRGRLLIELQGHSVPAVEMAAMFPSTETR